MAVLIDDVTPMRYPNPKARLVKGLVRHVSAPARTQLTLDLSNRSDGSRNMSKQRSLPSPRQSATSSRSKPNLLTELSLTQFVASRLRLARDE